MLDNVFCTSCEEGLKKLVSNSVDLVVTSPPYDELRTYQGFEFMIDEVIKELYRALKPGGVIVWVVGDETGDSDETATSFMHVLKFKEQGFKLYDTMIYIKKNPPPKNHKRYEQCFEYMFVFSKGIPSKINLIQQTCKYAGINKGISTYIQDKTDKLKQEHKTKEVSNFKTKFNIWEYTVGNSEKYRTIVKRKHPAKFPILLVRDQILSWSIEGDVVLDPFMGSGTTGKVAILNNRDFIGIEINEEYFNIAKERIEYYKKQ